MATIPSISKQWFIRGPDISDMTKSHVLQLYLWKNVEKQEEKFAFVYLGSLSDLSKRLLQKDVLKQDLLCVQVYTFFGVNNFGNT